MKAFRPTTGAIMAASGLLATGTIAATTPIGDPLYVYYLRESRELNPTPGTFTFVESLAASGEQHGGTLVRLHDMGSSFLGFPALDMVSAYNDGKTFWSQTLSPVRHASNGNVVGGTSEIYVAQSYRKDSADASLEFSFTGGRLQLVDYGSGRGDGFGLDAGARFSIQVVNHAGAIETFVERQFVSLYEHFGATNDNGDNTWQLSVTQEHGPLSRGLPPWQWSCDACGQHPQGFVTANLLAPYSGPISLDSIAVGGEFTVTFHLTTFANDKRQGETSALAYAKDPVSDGLGVGFELSGLTPTNQPSTSAIPEPHTYLLMALGLGLSGWRARAAHALRSA